MCGKPKASCDLWNFRGPFAKIIKILFCSVCLRIYEEFPATLKSSICAFLEMVFLTGHCVQIYILLYYKCYIFFLINKQY
jgi:hypothetical protein